jgi:hypothetical protein
MTKQPDRPKKVLRPLTDQELRAVAGGFKGKPGQFTSSSGGGGGTL